MKFIHLSDLHLGKRVNGFSMLDDQKYILSQIVSIAEQEQVQAIIIAGDIYDKQIPPAEAVQMLDSFLTGLADRGLLVLAVSGNHDSPERIAFGAQLMSGRGVYLSPVYNGTLQKVTICDRYGEVCFYLLPFIRPSVVRHIYGDEMINSYQEAVEAAIRHTDIDTSGRNVLIAHQFVTGASRCESEEILVGGLDNVDASVFDAFDYVALGHIHSPQYIGRKAVRYCGTPLKYSFSEADQEKSVTVAELSEKGNLSIRTIPLKPLHDMRIIKGTYMELTALSFYRDSDTEDYIQAILTDEEDIPDGLQKLRIIYPNLMRLEYDNRRTRGNGAVGAAQAVELKSELELFEEFYELQNNQPMSEEQRELVKGMIRELQEKQQRKGEAQ